MSAKRNITLELLKLFKLPVYVITAFFIFAWIYESFNDGDFVQLWGSVIAGAVGWFVIKVLDVFIKELSKDDE